MRVNDLPSYRTPRMNFAAALLALGHPLVEVEHGPHGLVFVFHDDGSMAARYEAYLTSRLPVDAMRFVRAQDELRDLRRGR